ncbi:DUF4440 domain-containing protein [Jeotgalibacillus sp. R-1-5s-1]|nr:DUF4440 domain-containing protein [Jeotgalibacillus sp. R-1-5s-1]
MERMDELKQVILFHEQELLNNEIRTSHEDLDRLIHKDFLEFGKSGGTWRKEDLMGEEGAGHIDVTIEGFDIRVLTSDTVQAIYQSKNNQTNEKANRCSIWKKEKDQWQMIFHQGTVAR